MSPIPFLIGSLAAFPLNWLWLGFPAAWGGLALANVVFMIWYGLSNRERRDKVKWFFINTFNCILWVLLVPLMMAEGLYNREEYR